MRVAVLGAGVVGIVTAYYLSERGHAVTVIERADDVAGGASHANGGQLSYSFTDALATPDIVRKLPGLLLNRDPAIRFRAAPSLALLRWSGAFLRQCTRRRARKNTTAVLQLAMRSSVLMDDLMNCVPLEFAFRRAGKLVLLSNNGELASATRSAALKTEFDCPTSVLTFAEACETEPALADMCDRYIAAVYSRNDHVADARAFTSGLAGWLQAQDSVSIRLNEPVTRIVTNGNKVDAIATDRGEYPVDAAVVCLGTGSAGLLQRLGIDPSIYPIRGYSMTLPPGENAPSVSITDLSHKIVFSRLGESVRIAGFADFVDFDTREDRARIDTLQDIARRVAPSAANYDVADIHGWAGVRPMTPDSRPRVGPTAINGLYLNTGHGMLGWTLACVTGHDVAAAVSRQANP